MTQSMLSSFSFDEEVRLSSTNAEREKYGLLSTLFGIIIALDYLERAYVRDSVTAAQYSPACTRLLSQYKTMLKLVGHDVPSIEDFMTRYKVSNGDRTCTLDSVGRWIIQQRYIA